MNLKIRRSQQSGLTGSITFRLLAIVDLDPEENAALHKYKFGKQIVYETSKAKASRERADSAYTVRGLYWALFSLFVAKVRKHIWTVNDLVKGKEITCKSITEMLAAEDEIKEACKGLSRLLFVCRHFDGEEVIAIEPFAQDELALAA